MNAGIIYTVLAPHTPRMGIEETAPEFVRALIAGSYELGSYLRAARPDVLIVHSTHWVTTFNWYVTCQARHKGVCVADEAPDLIPAIPYDRKGDPELGHAMVDEIRALGYPANPNEADSFTWDYGSCVPVKYLDPAGDIPVILIGTVPLSDLDECMAVGGAIRRAAEKTKRRAVFIASSSLSHKLVRGPEQWPTEARKLRDFAFIDMLVKGRVAEAKSGYHAYAEDVVGEMGGRAVATMLGTIDDDRGPYEAEQFGPYGQSSGSGNTNLVVRARA